MITCLTFDDISPAYLTVERLQEFLEQLGNLGIECTLFVVPTFPKQDHAKSQRFNDALKKSHEMGHEFGQHGYSHAGNGYFSEFGALFPLPFPSYNKQRDRICAGMKEIVKSLGVRPTGFRAPYYLHNMITLRVLADLGFSYDASKTIFKPVHVGGPRLKTMSNTRPFEIGRLIEIPTTGDYTLKSENPLVSLKFALRDFEIVKQDGGIFVINSHPNRVDLHNLFAFLKMFLGKVSGETEFMSLSKAKLNYDYSQGELSIKRAQRRFYSLVDLDYARV